MKGMGQMKKKRLLCLGLSMIMILSAAARATEIEIIGPNVNFRSTPQGKVTARETEVGNKLSALKDKLTAAAADGKLGAEQLDAVRKLHREAQWFFDFCYVENSEGAHNSALSLSCLDTSEAKIDEAMVLLGEKQDV